jgi:hypothetical protein
MGKTCIEEGQKNKMYFSYKEALKNEDVDVDEKKAMNFLKVA